MQQIKACSQLLPLLQLCWQALQRKARAQPAQSAGMQTRANQANTQAMHIQCIICAADTNPKRLAKHCLHSMTALQGELLKQWLPCLGVLGLSSLQLCSLPCPTLLPQPPGNPQATQ